MNNYVRNRVTAGAIGAYRLVKGTATDNTVAQAAAGTDKIVGATKDVYCDAAGDRIDIVHTGYVRLQAGGNIAFGDLLTSDANGKAVVVADGQRIGAMSLENVDQDTYFDAVLTFGEYKAPT